MQKTNSCATQSSTVSLTKENPATKQQTLITFIFPLTKPARQGLEGRASVAGGVGYSGWRLANLQHVKIKSRQQWSRKAEPRKALSTGNCRKERIKF